MIPEWCVLVPVKQWRSAKSRLQLPAAARMRLARALAADTLTALDGARSVGTVFVVAENVDSIRRLLDRLRLPAARFSVVQHPDGDLNDALRTALRHSRAVHGGPVAVMPADLPSVTAAEIDTVLARCRALPRAVVPDRQNVGTVLLTAQRAELLQPAFGTDSLARHVGSGAVPLQIAGTSGLRRDVDLPGDLATATGSRTRAVVRRLGPLRRSPLRAGGVPANSSPERTAVRTASRSMLHSRTADGPARVFS